MRLILPVLIVCLCCTACERRSDMSAMPDRGGHAFNPDPQAGYQPTSTEAGSSAPTRSHGSGSGRRVVVQDGERLYQIAEREGCELWSLITVNELEARPRAGDILTLPR